MFTVTLEGTDVLLRRTEQARLFTRTLTAAVMRSEAEAVMADSRANYVPIDTGALRDTGRVEGPVIDGGDIAYDLLYGGEGVDYAWTVHERLDVHHPHGSAKYLEIPFGQAERGMEQRLVTRLGAQLERAFG